MKWQPILTAIVLVCASLTAKSQPIDTLKYLQNTIVANKSYYIGKPLDSLIKDLKLDVVQAFNISHLYEDPDTIYANSIMLYFDNKEFSPYMLLNRVKRLSPDSVNFHIKSLRVTFLNPIALTRNRMQPNDLLGWWWTDPRKVFWGPQIIGDLEAEEN